MVAQDYSPHPKTASELLLKCQFFFTLPTNRSHPIQSALLSEDQIFRLQDLKPNFLAPNSHELRVDLRPGVTLMSGTFNRLCHIDPKPVPWVMKHQPLDH